MSEYPYKTADLAAELDCHPKTVLRRAADLGLGIDIGGRGGKRFSEDDRRAFLDSFKPDAPVPGRRRRSRRRAVA